MNYSFSENAARLRTASSIHIKAEDGKNIMTSNGRIKTNQFKRYIPNTQSQCTYENDIIF